MRHVNIDRTESIDGAEGDGDRTDRTEYLPAMVLPAIVRRMTVRLLPPRAPVASHNSGSVDDSKSNARAQVSSDICCGLLGRHCETRGNLSRVIHEPCVPCSAPTSGS
eukprot:6279843-Alexandrium_andersonii.AAC.1